ncbi:exported hypothetical protein [Burkholderiales bacterium]|jgi:hypothetical protein|nr:exported hypothetical protein [Burkholderiales bacterium]
MSTYKLLVAALVLTLLSACAESPEYLAKRARLDDTTPVCVGEADCNAKWLAAQHWIVNNAGFKIYKVTNDLIDTYYGSEWDERLVFRVTKEPLGDGKYKILASASCTNFFGCIPDRWKATLAFNKSIDAVTP